MVHITDSTGASSCVEVYRWEHQDAHNNRSQLTHPPDGTSNNLTHLDGQLITDLYGGSSPGSAPREQNYVDYAQELEAVCYQLYAPSCIHGMGIITCHQ